MRFIVCLTLSVVLLCVTPSGLAGQDSASAVARMGSGELNGVRVVDGVHFKSIQEAIDDASERGGGIVFVPSGDYVVKQIVLRAGVSLIGSGINIAPHGQGTVIEQERGADCDLIVSDTRLAPTEYQHGSMIANLRLRGNPFSTAGSGIRFNARVGEGTKFEHLLIQNFAECGIAILRGAEPLDMDDIHVFGNGTFGVDIHRTSGDLNQMVKISLLSGDDNGKALLRIGPSGGPESPESYLIEGVKAEKSARGRQNDVIILDGMNGSPVVIIGAGASNTSDEPANSVVKIVGTPARVYWWGLARGPHYDCVVDDTASGQKYREVSGRIDPSDVPRRGAP